VRRRDLFGALSAAAIAGSAVPDRSALAQLTQLIGEEFDIDPYFLDSGVLSDNELGEVIELERDRQRQMEGQTGVITRGLQPRRAPTYRFVHWVSVLPRGLGAPFGSRHTNGRASRQSGNRAHDVVVRAAIRRRQPWLHQYRL
jgi:hypothetical protein